MTAEMEEKQVVEESEDAERDATPRGAGEDGETRDGITATAGTE